MNEDNTVTWVVVEHRADGTSRDYDAFSTEEEACEWLELYEDTERHARRGYTYTVESRR